MKYYREIKLKDGKTCVLRNGTQNDGAAVLDIFNRTHEETDFLASYADESSLTAEAEGEFLKRMEESETDVQIIAEIDGQAAGLAGINAIGSKYKVKHRTELGISIVKEYWGCGIGRAMMNACIECAKTSGFSQIELMVVEENGRAVKLYESLGFKVYGRNEKGFKSKYSGYQPLLYMAVEL